MLNSKKPTEKVTEHVPSKSPLKTIAIVAGSLFALSHIGLLGYVLRPQEPAVQQPPTFNIPRGPYSSYKIKAGKDGYEIEYRADDPKILESEKSLDLDKTKKGFFGGGSEKRTEYRRDEYTREGTRNLGGGVNTEEGKSVKDVECLIADAGARSQGAMAGTALASGAVLATMLESRRLQLSRCQRPFRPEGGAYAGHQHG